MKTFKCVLLLASLSAAAFASSERIVTVSATGYGANEHLATEDALISAVGQFKGVDVDHEQIRLMMQQKTNGNVETQHSLSGGTSLKTRGGVKGYEIADITCDQRCTATLDVYFAEYNSPGPASEKRRKIVVSPFSGINSSDLTDGLQAALVSSRRFAVLDRQHNDEYEQEKALLLSSDASQKEQIRIGQVMGLDYLIVGEYKENAQAPEGGEYALSLTGERLGEIPSGIVKYSVILLATRQVMKQGALSVYASEGLEQTGKKISEQIIDAIYPLRIISTSLNEVTINVGSGFIEAGQTYSAFQRGEKLIDPYHGESLGYKELLVGTVEVVETKPKYSIARVLEGDWRRMKGGILRLARSQFVDDGLGATPGSVEVGSSGGIILPGSRAN
ncbi:hypothetical protein CA267_013360 [Alteromonas pelagimontana]|uniref:Uncharacterized protein n=1 Tax=Alteromonas pelagimontana TaxID=1858656 RepID=A0A6M4MES7_9ALTE|nr:CsgG/HfaB family protein [Alteromonas pelagimontana]QJR81684.1 hypothetical protein CA267_013360 [Alteromonas pelagimontana]